MKNKLLKALALSCIALTYVGCNKDANPSSDNADVATARNPLEQLRSFKKQIESPLDEKNGETITFDDALWDVENYFNLTYSDAECYYSNVNEHEFTLLLPANEQQQVLASDAVQLYEQVVEHAREALLADDFDDKGFISLTVKEINTNVRGGALITFSGKTGERTNYNPPTAHVYGPFGADDDWMFAAPLGKCDDPDIPSGADEQFQEHLYAELIEPFVETDASHRNIYVDRKRFIFDGTNYAGIYYNNTGNLCIGHEFMNDHYNAEKRVITQTIPGQYHLFGYSPISIEIEGCVLDDNAVTHHNEIEYGIRMEVSTEEFGDVKDLLILQ